MVGRKQLGGIAKPVGLGQTMWRWGLVGLLGVHLLDIVSTLLATHYARACEQNSVLANAETCGLLVGRAIYIKCTLGLLHTLLPAWFIKKFSGWAGWGALALLPDIVQGWPIVFHNFEILFIALSQRINF